jgi:hypothetical protein
MLVYGQRFNQLIGFVGKKLTGNPWFFSMKVMGFFG